MIDLLSLVQHHRVDPGPLVHVGNVQGDEVQRYYQAGFNDITVVESSVGRIRSLRTRFPGVDVREVTGEQPFRLDAPAHVIVVNMPGHELAVLEFAPWDTLSLIIVRTSASDNTSGPSSYDLVTEMVITRGFVEVGSWWYPGEGLDVAFVKVAN